MSESRNTRQIFIASFMTLIAAGVGFAVRGGSLGQWAARYGFTNTELGGITGGGLIGFGLVIVAGSLIAERFNYKAVFVLAFVLHILSAVITLAATPVFDAIGKNATFWCLYVGVFLFAVANGLCEAVINPLVATLYPKQKTHYLNILHAGWPGGLIVGGLLAACFLGAKPLLTTEAVAWEIPMALYLIPVIWYGIVILREPIPQSEAGEAGISFGEMIREFAAPMLLLLLFLQACVGYVELGTDSWIAKITDSFLAGQGLLLFVWASSIMFVLRFFAGPLVERLNPLGLLCASSVLGVTGLYMLGSVKAAGMVWLAVSIYGVGKTFLWPTMLGIVGERFPRGGALTMGAVGAAGALSGGLLGGPGIGYTQDVYATAQLREQAAATYERYEAAGENRFLFFPKVKGLDGQRVATLTEPEPGATLTKDYKITPEALEDQYQWWQSAQEHKDEDLKPIQDASVFGSRMALKWTAAVPAVMFVGYLLLVLYFGTKGGYRTLEIGAERV